MVCQIRDIIKEKCRSISKEQLFTLGIEITEDDIHTYSQQSFDEYLEKLIDDLTNAIFLEKDVE